MSDVDIIQKREEDERLDTAEDPNEEVRYQRRVLLPYKAFRQHRDPETPLAQISCATIE